MGWISAVFAHKAIDAATNANVSGPDRKSLFTGAGMDPDAPADPAYMIPDTAFFALLERLATDTENGRAIPVRIGAAMRCDDYGAFGLAFKSAPNLLGSYRRVERYGRVVTSIANFRVVVRDTTASMQVIPGTTTRLGLTMTNELALAAAVSLSREVGGGAFIPAAVHFTHAAPDVNTEQTAHFGCPVHYGSDRDAMEVDLCLLNRPNRLGDAGLAAFFDAHLTRELETLGNPTGIEHRVLDQIGGALSEGVPTLTYVAGQLGMSSRTLQRRLSEAGLAYQDLVTEARKELAERLLRNTGYTLVEVAFLTGFSDQSTFTRAFKRWTGQTPSGYRREA